MPETDPLLHLPRKTSVAVRKNKRQQQKRICVLATVILAMIALILGGMSVIKSASKRNSKPRSILGRAKEAQSLVNFNKETGEYTVDIDYNVPPETTFAELADVMLLPWYEASMIAILDDPAWTSEGGINPFNVKMIRHCMRITRIMINIFSPVFPDDTRYVQKVKDPQSKGKKIKDKSLWRKLRQQYRAGYHKLGDLQDLFDVEYSEKLLEKRRAPVMAWREGFMRFMKENRIRRYLYSDFASGVGGIDPKGRYYHDSSHLFWSKTKEEGLPRGDDSGTHSIRKLGILEITNCMEILDSISNYTTVLPIVHEETFHNFRKEIRTFTDQYSVLGDILLPDNDNDSPKVLTKTIDDFLETSVKLGEINDMWMARDIYVKEQTHTDKQVELAEKMDKSWFEFLDWKDERDIRGQLQHVLDLMNELYVQNENY